MSNKVDHEARRAYRQAVDAAWAAVDAGEMTIPEGWAAQAAAQKAVEAAEGRPKNFL